MPKDQALGFVSHLGLDSLPLLRNDESEKNERGAENLNKEISNSVLV